jgi:hypothetical protein
MVTGWAMSFSAREVVRRRHWRVADGFWRCLFGVCRVCGRGPLALPWGASWTAVQSDQALGVGEAMRFR